MPILGIMASQISGHLETNSYESIATATPAGSSTFTFSSIPSTYKHLQVRVTAAASDGLQGGYMRINGSTSPGEYYTHYLYGTGSAAGAGGLSNSFIYSYFYGTGSAFAATIIDIFDYTSTNKNKTTRSLAGYDNNGTGQIQLYSGLFYATPAAITSLTFLSVGANWATGTQFALYGIRG
jgi:hypothetical protein